MYGGYRYFWGGDAPPSTTAVSNGTAERDASPDWLAADTGGGPTAPAAAPATDPAKIGSLLSEARRALSSNEDQGASMLDQVLAQDPRGAMGKEAAQLLLPIAARKGLVRREITLKWRLGQMDGDAWKKLDDANAAVLTPQRLSKDPETSFCVVAGGDSLEKIAKARGTTVDLIQRLNGRPENDTTIHPGDRLKILPVRGRVSIEVRKSEFCACLLYDGNLLKKYRVGIGLGDLTPEGEFKIATRLKNPDWWRDGKMIPYGDPENILGTRWLGFDKPLQKFALHGTSHPETIGKKASNGCIRMENKDVEEMYAFTPPGAVVWIVP